MVITFLGLFLQSKAQVNSKEEAVAFIQKFYKDYVPKESRSAFNSHVINYNFTFKNCIGEIHIQLKQQNSSSTNDFSITNRTITIPFSTVYADLDGLLIKSKDNTIIFTETGKSISKDMANQHIGSFDCS